MLTIFAILKGQNMQSEKFNYKSYEEIRKDLNELGLKLEYSDNLDILKKAVKVDGYTLPNSLAVHPMEGCDGNIDGTPGELTIRRYKRFAKGGAGLLWFEATAVVPEARANPRQLCINKKNVSAFEDIFNIIMISAMEANGKDHSPLCIMQLTHSGRFSVPYDKPRPIIAYHNTYLNQRMNLSKDYPIITDDELERLEDKFVAAAKLAKKAGFHGVDVKGCHRYLASELLSAYNREGKYGGDFEGRTLFIRNIVDKIKSELSSDFIVASRLNIYDGIPYPYGFGTDNDDYTKYDLAEPLKLVEVLHKKGVNLINITMGTPYYNPHVNRPYDSGGYAPPEHQLVGISRLLNGAGEVQKRYPDIAVVSTGYTWLRQFAPNIAAGMIKSGKTKIAGFGREAFAYPDFAKDIIEDDRMKKEKCCITCGKCTELMRAKSMAGCVIRDSEVYAKLYKENVK